MQHGEEFCVTETRLDVFYLFGTWESGNVILHSIGQERDARVVFDNQGSLDF